MGVKGKVGNHEDTFKRLHSHLSERNSRKPPLTQALLRDGENGQNAQGYSGWHLEEVSGSVLGGYVRDGGVVYNGVVDGGVVDCGVLVGGCVVVW